MHFYLIKIAIIVTSIAASALHEQCASDKDCGTFDTFCRNNVCKCKETFAVFADSCIQLSSPKIGCSGKRDRSCQQSLGVRSVCTKNMQCACKPFHHLHKGQCIKNRDLYDICEFDYQCYCGKDCQDKIACIGNNCTCTAGNIAYRSRQCISFQLQKTNDANKIFNSTLFPAFIIFYLIYK